MKFEVSNSRCCYCGACVGVCERAALYLHHSYLEHRHKSCIWCRKCATICPVRAITISKAESVSTENKTPEGTDHE